jgi:hypothetical protein
VGHQVTRLVNNGKSVEFFEGLSFFCVSECNGRIKRIVLSQLVALIKALRNQADLHYYHDPELPGLMGVLNRY